MIRVVIVEANIVSNAVMANTVEDVEAIFLNAEVFDVATLPPGVWIGWRRVDDEWLPPEEVPSDD